MRWQKNSLNQKVWRCKILEKNFKKLVDEKSANFFYATFPEFEIKILNYNEKNLGAVGKV